ncbi:MAG TPA: pyridoxamine 5'-phosphate oxidase family protein [Thermoflexales bacterium]|mgnify:CR=1 FL=1|nr:pyridoxamine 5'-phosphate oxidase family protein [Thermoflexales bacterium]HQZ21760.1 pyridoxamine 5'-phosphate oxidase family protein [Thermoflexales bacterium]
MTTFPITDQNRVRVKSKRGTYEREVIYPIVDEALICHVGLVFDNQPFVIPTIHARIDDTIYLHGSPGSRMKKAAEAGAPFCITCTLVDGIVFARSVFNHSMNYRSAVLFGKGRIVTDADESYKAQVAITDHIAKGRWDDARVPNEKEIAKTLFIAIDVEAASAKVRTGPPGDDEEDLALPYWAGVLPLAVTPAAPINDPALREGIALPEYVKKFKR